VCEHHRAARSGRRVPESWTLRQCSMNASIIIIGTMPLP